MFQRIYIEISNVCNLNCSFCIKNQRESKFMTRNEFNHILNEIKGFSQHIYFHVQGEPLLHPELLNFLDDSYEKGFKVHLVTNGTLLANVSSKLYTHPALAQLSISLHSIEMIENDKNYTQLKELINSIHKLKVSLFLRIWTNKSIKLFELINSLIYPLTYELIKKRVRIKRNLFIDSDEEFVWPSLSLPFQSIQGTCHAGTKMMAILSNGEISPCCLDKDGILSIGNIFKESFKDAMVNDKYISIINGFKNIYCVEQLCQNCSYRLRFNKK